MPVIMCKYCEYLGQGKTYEDILNDVRIHELNEHLLEKKKKRVIRG